jgi:hypothetical protein
MGIDAFGDSQKIFFLSFFRAAMAGAVAETDVMGRTFLLMTGGKEGM